MVKTDKRKNISPMTLHSIFLCRYRKNNLVGKKFGSIGNRMHVLCPFEVQIFTSTPLKSHFVKLQMAVDFSRTSFGIDSFFKHAYFFKIYVVDPILLTYLTFVFSL